MPDRGPRETSSPTELARAGVAALGDPGQALAVWERRLGPGGAAVEERVTVTAVAEGRAASAAARDASVDGVRRAARAAGLHARRMRALPAPELPRAAEVDGGRPACEALAEAHPAELDSAVRAAVGPGVAVTWSAGLARVAVVSSTGVDVAEARSFVRVTVRGEAADGRSAVVTRGGDGRGARADAGPPARRADVAAVSADLAALAAAEVRGLLGVPHVDDGIGTQGAEPGAGSALAAVVGAQREDAPAPGRVAAVLGPEAVAVVLDALRSDLGVGLALGDGPFAVRAGTPIAAPAITLVDDPAILPRSYDAEGVPRQRTPLIGDGVVVGGVRDSAAAARTGAPSTGHATRPLTLAPQPEHLVLATGGAHDVAALCEALGDGLYLPALATAYQPGADGARIHAAPGAALVRGGVPVGGLVGLRVAVDALAVLRHTHALTATARLVPLRGHCPGGIGAALVPALLATAGIRVGHVERA